MRLGFVLILTLANGVGRERKSKIGEIVSRKRFNNERINEMSDKRQETIADIVAEMRIGDLCAEDTSAARPAYINDFLAGYADRIEAAWKREQEAGAEAAQICSEIGEIVGREATTEKSSAVGNADIVREVAQEMLNTSMQEITAESINRWATRLAAACEQSVTDCNQLNNTAAMREALNAIKDTLDEWRSNGEMMEHWQYSELFGIANAALSEPIRNCDVGTAEEQAERFDYFCYNHRSREKGCGDCPLLDGGPCELAWAQMPYEEGGAK